MVFYGVYMIEEKVIVFNSSRPWNMLGTLSHSLDLAPVPGILFYFILFFNLWFFPCDFPPKKLTTTKFTWF